MDNATSSSEIGQWWRFDRYKLVDGVIRPSADATLEAYDPWVSYNENKSNSPEKLTPYHELVKLAESLKLSPGEPGMYALEPAGEQELLDWCSRYGLLGVLPHRAHSVTLAARWRKPLGRNPPSDLLFPSVTRQMRANFGWVTSETQYFGSDAYHLVGEPEREGQLVAEEDYPPRMPRPSVTLQDFDSAAMKEEDITSYWSFFFPEVRPTEYETFDYPLALSEPFWREYGEPIDQFLRASLVLRDALDGLSLLRPLSEMTDEELWRFRRGLVMLESLTSPVSRSLNVDLEAGLLGPRWSSKSLLAALAMMAMEDQSRGGRVLRCSVCKSFFTSKSPKALYCSGPCRWRAQKRTYRSGRK